METNVISKQRYQLIIGLLIAHFVFIIGIRFNIAFFRSSIFSSSYLSLGINLSLVIIIAYLLSDYFKVKEMYNVRTFYITQAAIITIGILYQMNSSGMDSSISLIMSGLINVVAIVTNLILYAVMAFSTETKQHQYLRYFGLILFVQIILTQLSIYIFYSYSLMNLLTYLWYGAEILFIIHFVKEMEGSDDDGIIDEFSLDD